MDYEEQWDTNMIQMWHDANNEYAKLSTYVANVDQLGDTTNNNGLNGKYEVPHLCMITFTSQVRTHATKCAYNLSKPKLTNAIWGAGLSFSVMQQMQTVMISSWMIRIHLQSLPSDVIVYPFSRWE